MSTKPFRYIGSVSHGTLRAEDLIPAFLDVLAELNPESANQTSKDIQEYLRAASDEELAERESEIVNELIDTLSNEAPPFFYFGAHEGDGSDFGFWFDSHGFDQAVQDEEIWKCDVLPEEWERKQIRRLTEANEKVNTVEYFAVVSDHGNVTLYDLEGNEIWAIV